MIVILVPFKNNFVFFIGGKKRPSSIGRRLFEFYPHQRGDRVIVAPCWVNDVGVFFCPVFQPYVGVSAFFAVYLYRFSARPFSRANSRKKFA